MNHIEMQTARNSFRNTHSKAKAEADIFRSSHDSAQRNGEQGPDIATLSELAFTYFECPEAYFKAKTAFENALNTQTA